MANNDEQIIFKDDTETDSGIDERPSTSNSVVIAGVKKAPIISVDVPVFLYFLGYGIFVPAQQAFIYEAICEFKYKEKSQEICPFIDNAKEFSDQENAVQADFAIFSTWSSLCLFPAAMFATIIMGAWCDRFSHRIPLVFPNIGIILIAGIYLAFNYLPVLHETINPVYLAIVSLLPGVSGFVLTQIMAASSYCSLASDAENRTTRLAVIQAIIVLGQTVGYFANAFLFTTKATGYLLAFVVQIAINVYAIVAIFVFMPELRSMSDVLEEKARFGEDSWCRYLCAPHLIIKSCTRAVFAKHKLRFYRCIMLVVYALCAAFIGLFGLQNVTYDFLTLQPISFSQFQYSIYMTVYAGTVDLALLVLLPILRKNWCNGFFPISDATLAIIGLISRMAALISIGLGDFYPSISPWVYSVVNMCAPLAFVSLRAGMSKIYEPSEQGRLFAVIGLIEYSLILLANLAFNALYAALVSSPSSVSGQSSLVPIVHGYTFLFVAGLSIIPTILIIWLGNQPIPNWSFQYSQP